MENKTVWENIKIKRKRRRSRWFIELKRIKLQGFKKKMAKTKTSSAKKKMRRRRPV